MLGRLKELVTGTSRSASNRSYLGGHLDKVCTRYAARYEELSASNAFTDALDVLAQLVMEEILSKDVELAAARAYLSILIDNEHLPPSHQLNENELVCLRELLLGYFNNDDSVNDRGSQVLSLIDKKFVSGEFSQARILLQIFDMSEETKQNNERNLYYEEMIMRLDMTVGKSKSLSNSVISAATDEHASDEMIIKAFNCLAKECNAHFHLQLVDLDEFERWNNALASVPQSVKDYLYDYIPVMQWRQLGVLSEPIEKQITRHMTFEMLRKHVQVRLRMSYFLLLASGNTGYEWFIFAFTEWSKKHFDVDVKEVFPALHRSCVVDNMILQDALDIAIDRFYGPAMNRIVMTPEDLSRSFKNAVNRILVKDAGLIPPGDYNLGDFLLDDLLPFEYEDPSFVYRLYCML